MEYIFYCVLSAIAIIVSCVGTMTKRIKWYQYIIMMTILAFIIYYFYGEWGQLLTPFIVGGIILISSILIKQHLIPNVCIGLSIHLLNCVLNNFLLWGIGSISPHILEILYNEEILVFPIFWLFFLLIMTSIYRKILYEKCDILRYFNVSKKIKIGIIIEMVFFGLLYSMNIVWGERIGYTPRMLVYNSSFLLICFLINVMLFLYLGYAVKVEENQQLLIHDYSVALKALVRKTGNQ